MIAGLVLAAGGGTRFGGPAKQLAGFRGRPLLEWAVSAQCAVEELERIVVVLGSRADEIAATVDLGRAQTVVCGQWATGQATSLRTGLAALDGAEKVIVTLGDAPLVTPEAIARCVPTSPPARAVYRGRPGHPVVLGAAEIATVLATAHGDTGARELLRGATEIELGDICSGRDVDTPEDLVALEELSRETRAVI